MPPLFSQCRPCGTHWPTRDHFLSDPGLEIVEYQGNFEDLTAGAFIFCHACGSTLSLSVRHFNGLYHGTIFNVRATNSDD